MKVLIEQPTKIRASSSGTNLIRMIPQTEDHWQLGEIQKQWMFFLGFNF